MTKAQKRKRQRASAERWRKRNYHKWLAGCRKANKKWRDKNKPYFKSYWLGHKKQMLKSCHKYIKSRPDYYKNYYWDHREAILKKNKKRYHERKEQKTLEALRLQEVIR